MVHRSALSRDKVVLLQTLSRQLGRYLYPIHRLDRATSGAIVFGFTSDAARAVQDAMQTGEVTKRYLALCRGETPERFESKRPLSDDKKVKRDAHTSFERLAFFFRVSVVRATLHTGRRHQIRRHLAHLAHQIIGDTTYGKGRINRFFREEHGLPRLCLHAEELAFPHPATGEPLRVVCPLAADLRQFIEGLPDADPTLATRLH